MVREAFDAHKRIDRVTPGKLKQVFGFFVLPYLSVTFLDLEKSSLNKIGSSITFPSIAIF